MSDYNLDGERHQASSLTDLAANDEENAVRANTIDVKLCPGHVKMLVEESGISPADIAERGYFTASDPEQLRELGFAEYQLRTPALVIPVHGVEGGPLFYRARPDNPREHADKPGKFTKSPWRCSGSGVGKGTEGRSPTGTASGSWAARSSSPSTATPNGRSP